MVTCKYSGQDWTAVLIHAPYPMMNGIAAHEKHPGLHREADMAPATDGDRGELARRR